MGDTHLPILLFAHAFRSRLVCSPSLPGESQEDHVAVGRRGALKEE
jgi:hypothetical protein